MWHQVRKKGYSNFDDWVEYYVQPGEAYISEDLCDPVEQFTRGRGKLKLTWPNLDVKKYTWFGFFNRCRVGLRGLMK